MDTTILKISLALSGIKSMQDKGLDSKARKAIHVLTENLSLLKQSQEVINCKYLHASETISKNIEIKNIILGSTSEELYSINYRREWIDKKI